MLYFFLQHNSKLDHLEPVVQNLDQNDLDLEIPRFATQGQVIHLTFLLVFQRKIGLDPDTHFFRLPNLNYWCYTEPLKGHGDGKKYEM